MYKRFAMCDVCTRVHAMSLQVTQKSHVPSNAVVAPQDRLRIPETAESLKSNRCSYWFD